VTKANPILTSPPALEPPEVDVGCAEVAAVAVGCAEAVVAVGATVVAVGSAPQAERSTAPIVRSESAPNLVLRVYIIDFLHLIGIRGK